MAVSRVADLTVDELKELIREVVAQTIIELLADPDAGLELRENFRVERQQSLEAVQAGAKTRPMQGLAHLLSEPALAEDWNRAEEDKAWLHLQLENDLVTMASDPAIQSELQKIEEEFASIELTPIKSIQDARGFLKGIDTSVE